MAEAYYFHATLYRFNPEARRQVIQDFNNVLQDTSAKCTYDVEQDVSSVGCLLLFRALAEADRQIFCLRCPHVIGHRADEVLGEAISAYVETELAAAELGNVSYSAYFFYTGIDSSSHSTSRAFNGTLKAVSMRSLTSSKAKPFQMPNRQSQRVHTKQVAFIHATYQ